MLTSLVVVYVGYISGHGSFGLTAMVN